MPDEGATPEPENLSECMGRWKHRPLWVWVNGQMTDDVVCGTCGARRTAELGGGGVWEPAAGAAVSP